MAHFRKIIVISFILAVLCLTTTLGFSSDESPSAESTEVGKKTDAGPVHSHVKTSSGRANTKKKVQESDNGDNNTQTCAPRHKTCRSFGPKPLPCCEGYVCKTTYGEQHCVDPDTKIQ